MLTQIVLVASLTLSGGLPGAQGRATCEVGRSTMVSRSLSGIALVSNLGLIEISCRVPRRPSPKAGTVQYGLKAEATVYEVSPDGARSMVPSAVNVSGGGGDSQSEYVSFYLDVPIDSTERDAAIRTYLAKIAASATNEHQREMARGLQKMDPRTLAPMFRQQRVGRFQVDCRVLDQGRVVGIGRVDLEVLFKGRFFDQPEFDKK
jgi:hypothetical protein